MKQNFVIINNEKYEQGTIFVTKYHDGITFTERRITFMFYDTNTSKYWFKTPNKASSDSITLYPDTRFMSSLIKTDKPTDTELKILNDSLARIRENHKQKNNGFDEFLLRFLAVILTMLFPPIGIILIIISFVKGK